MGLKQREYKHDKQFFQNYEQVNETKCSSTETSHRRGEEITDHEGILFNLCQAKDINNNTTNKECVLMVDVAIEMADHLMEKLYGAKPEE